MYDVAVVGGGPVGSYVAYKLAEMGYGVVVLERKERPGEQVCCTGIISQECVSSFDVDDDVILRRANSARLFSPSGGVVRLWREEPQACIVDRAAFDRAMASKAQGKGAEYQLSSLVKGITFRDDRVEVEVACQKKKLNFESRAVVIAAGFGSPLVKGLGLGQVSNFVLGAQAEVGAVGVEEVEVYFGQEVAPGFFAWLVPISPQTALAGLLSCRNPGFYLRKLMSSLLAQGKIVSAEAELSYGRIPLKPLAKTFSNRLLVVGGAAGQVKPTTGGGIYFGLLCADMAANTLHRALENDDLSATGLASYEREWRRKLGRELAIEYYARMFYERLNDRQIDRLFDIIKSNGIDEVLLKADNLSFDWHGEAVLKVLRHRAVSKAIKLMKLPFSLARKVR